MKPPNETGAFRDAPASRLQLRVAYMAPNFLQAPFGFFLLAHRAAQSIAARSTRK